MAKGCGIFAALGLVSLMLFCGLGAFALNKGRQIAAEHEANKTPEQKAAEADWEAKQKQSAADRVRESMAVKQAEADVSKVLKTPSVAKFSLEGLTFGPELVVVTGHVDSQNTFGAMVRTKVHARYLRNRLAFIRVGDQTLENDGHEEAKQIMDSFKK